LKCQVNFCEESWPSVWPAGLQPGSLLRFQPGGLTGRRVELKLRERENQLYNLRKNALKGKSSLVQAPR